MKKFTVEYNGWHSLKEETGDDFVFFDYIVYENENPEDAFPAFLPYEMIENEVEKTIDGGSAILDKIKNRITGWGPQEPLYVKELEECGIDLEKMVKKAVESNVDLAAEEIKWNNLRSDPKTASLISENLEQAVSEIKIDNDQYYLLCTRLEKVITDEVVNLFPVLLNSSSEHIIELSHILVNYIPDLAEELNELIFEANKENP